MREGSRPSLDPASIDPTAMPHGQSFDRSTYALDRAGLVRSRLVGTRDTFNPGS
jgi:hypothetical protein